jgi:hypothetical protein
MLLLLLLLLLLLPLLLLLLPACPPPLQRKPSLAGAVALVQQRGDGALQELLERRALPEATLPRLSKRHACEPPGRPGRRRRGRRCRGARLWLERRGGGLHKRGGEQLRVVWRVASPQQRV